MLLNKSRNLALLGLFLAINQILIVLSAVLDVSSLTFLAAAAMMIGIAIVETDRKMGAAFFAASCILGLILCPNPLYIATYAVMGVYVFIKELLDPVLKKRMPYALVMVIKLLAFNVYYIPLLILFPQILLEAEETNLIMIVLWALTQVVVVLCDMVYDRVILFYKRNIRRHKGEF